MKKEQLEKHIDQVIEQMKNEKRRQAEKELFDRSDEEKIRSSFTQNQRRFEYDYEEDLYEPHYEEDYEDEY
ncbi:MAG: hypothetical protein Q4D77_02160 [Peptostreptococcaceae bacterium]|nr:hypothetical protein [Peptostreptococcaceae bacterium]